jgi:hypothetical protein
MNNSYQNENLTIICKALEENEYKTISQLVILTKLSRSTIERILRRFPSFFESQLYESGKKGRPLYQYKLRTIVTTDQQSKLDKDIESIFEKILKQADNGEQ